MYVISAHHNGLYFFFDRTDVRRCNGCKHLLAKWEEKLVIQPFSKFRNYEVGYSYDGVLVVSKRFKTLYETSHMTGLNFIPVGHDLYAVMASKVVHYDAVRRGTLFEKKCDTCGQYESVVGADPVLLKDNPSIPPLGFARTDLEFASKDEKHPLIVCGDEAAMILKAAKLKRLELDKVKS